MAEAETKTTRKTTPDVQDVDVSGVDLYVPAETRENYLQIARDAAAATGKAVKECLTELADGFDRQHKVSPGDGWNYLAEWARAADPDESTGPTAAQLATARAIESARRDPEYALQAQPQVVAAAIEARDAHAEATGIGTDPSTGVVANPGTVTVETTDATDSQ